MHVADPETLEQRLYRQRFDDGLLDVFLGVAVTGMGVLWFTPAAGMAGVLPALLVPLYPPFHQRFVAPRAGHVRFSEARQSGAKRGLWALVAVGIGTFALGVATFFAMNGGSPSALLVQVVPALPAALLALAGLLAAALLSVPRLGAYSGAMLAFAALTVALELHPGWPLFLGGLAVLLPGVLRFVRFLRDNPLEEAS